MSVAVSLASSRIDEPVYLSGVKLAQFSNWLLQPQAHPKQAPSNENYTSEPNVNLSSLDATGYFGELEKWSI